MATFLMSTSAFLDDIKEWSGPFFDAQQLGVRLNFDVDIKSAVQTDEVEVDVTQCENRLTSARLLWHIQHRNIVRRQCCAGRNFLIRKIRDS